MIPDGLDELRHEMPSIIDLIARTARWVAPETFQALPVWYPETARGKPMYDAKWQRKYTNTSGATGLVSERSEPNIQAGKALAQALGTSKRPNWTVCHIWGVDDPKFQKQNRIVKDPKYYSCVGNMVWLPTPLKGFTDCVPGVKQLLRTCAFHLYGWACEHEDVEPQANEVKSGTIPANYPESWPTSERNTIPSGVVPLNARIGASIDRRKAQLRRMIGDPSLTHFPRDHVLKVLEFWKIKL